MNTAPYTPTTASEGPRTGISEWAPSLPEIDEDEPFADLVRDLSLYIEDIIDLPHTWEQLRGAQGTHLLKPLISSLYDRCHHQNIVAALLVCKWHYSSLEPDDRGIIETRAHVCEIVAWRFLSHLSEDELIDYLLYELPSPKELSSMKVAKPSTNGHTNCHNDYDVDEYNESTELLSERSPGFGRKNSFHDAGDFGDASVEETDQDPTLPFVHLNALEIAAVADAKRFLSQRVVQKVVNGIWHGDIIFWDSMNVKTKKKAQKYNKRKSIDPYTRLRVPKYQKVFEALFFATFLGLYYAVLLERHPERLGMFEVFLYIWIAAFACEEFGEYRDAGSLFYAADFWSLWDLCIILIGVAFLLARIIGLAKGDTDEIMNVSFDILSLEALFLVPRTCALLSLNPFFGTLIPCLKEMTRDFVKFLVLIVILYLGRCASWLPSAEDQTIANTEPQGFLTTFTLLARHEYTFTQMSWTLINVFFGSAYLGFVSDAKLRELRYFPLTVVN
ncbi:hypothetical protein MMC13_003392 [Lambiella insularis]|nr:hypothetical protein [Lambiella insularis]